MDTKITILITDDHPMTRAGICSSLEQAVDLEIVGEAQDGNEAMELIAKLQPDVHLLDLKMPGMRAYEVEKWTRENYPKTATLVLTAHDRDFYLAEMMRAGVSGYLDKSEHSENLLAAIRRAANGEHLFTLQQYERVHQWNETVGDRWESLTAREREISKMLTTGDLGMIYSDGAWQYVVMVVGLNPLRFSAHTNDRRSVNWLPDLNKYFHMN